MNLDTICALQEQLQSLLGLEYNSYLECLRDWFGQKITKDFFDEQMIKLLKGQAFDVHNEMIKQIVFECHGSPAPASSLTPAPPAPAITASTSTPSTSAMAVAAAAAAAKNKTSSTNQQRSEPEPIVQVQKTANRTVIYQSGGEQAKAKGQEYATINLVDSEELMPYSVANDKVEVKPIVPVNWLYTAHEVKVNANEIERAPFLPMKNFSPPSLAHDATGLIQSDGILPNITHGYDIADRLHKLPYLKAHFEPQPKDQPYLSTGASLHGIFLLKAWQCKLDSGVDPSCTQLVQEAVKQHIRKLVTEVVKQRRAFRMRNDKVCHSIGAPYPNPYLLQGQHLYDTAYTSETTKMADVMQVPTMLCGADHLERIAILQVAAAAPPKSDRFPAHRATLADLLNVIENDPGIIPFTTLRFKLLGEIGEKYKGFSGAFSDQEEDDDMEDDQSDLLPICSY